MARAVDADADADSDADRAGDGSPEDQSTLVPLARRSTAGSSPS